MTEQKEALPDNWIEEARFCIKHKLSGYAPHERAMVDRLCDLALQALTTRPAEAATHSAVDVDVDAVFYDTEFSKLFGKIIGDAPSLEQIKLLRKLVERAFAVAKPSAVGVEALAVACYEAMLRNKNSPVAAIEPLLRQALAGAAQGGVPSGYVLVKKQDLEDIWQAIDSMAERPYDNEPEFRTCLAIGGFVRKRVAVLTAAPEVTE